MPSAINADNGVVSGTAGLKSSADNSGVLDLQTNGTTAISISASQVVTFANQPAYTGGTANGVLYLNGSKVLTSGSALVFDGTNLGVGISSPTQRLHVVAAGGYNATFSENSANNVRLQLYVDANETALVSGYNTTPKPMTFYTGGSLRATLDTSGNLGLGVTPSGNSLFEAISGGAQKNIFQAWYGSSNNLPFVIATDNANGHAYLGWNTKQGAASTQTYLVNNWANKLEVSSGQFRFYTAASGTAGNTITFTQPMTLDSTGALFINRASNGVHLQTQVNSVNTAALGSFNGAPTVGSNLTGYSGIMFNGASFEPTLDGLNVRQSALVDIGSTNYRFKTGHFTGINFPATQVASADANTLDDYEEGTWTPTLTFGGGAGSLTYSVQNGNYVKVGSLVNVQAIIVVSNKGSASGDMGIVLPFTARSGTYYGATSLTWNFITYSANSYIISAQVGSGSANMFFYNEPSGGTKTGLNVSQCGSSFEIIFTTSYQTA